MSDFAINTVTPAGMALIAQATAANPIVYVDSRTGSQYALDSAELVTKPLEWYDGLVGTIFSASATDRVAKITTSYRNTTSTAYPVKSVCIRARLQSQTDSQAIILAAMSDGDSEIEIPSNMSPAQVVRFKFNIAVTNDNTVEAVNADGVTLSDLQRFVSMYKAGDPTAGDDQQIRGDKEFLDNTTFNKTQTFYGAATFDAPVTLVTGRNLTVGGKIACSGEISAGTKFVVYPDNPYFVVDDTQVYCGEDLFVGADAEIEGTLTLHDNLTVTSQSSVTIDDGDLSVSGEVSAGTKLVVYPDNPYFQVDNTQVYCGVDLDCGGDVTIQGGLTVNYNITVDDKITAKGFVGLAPSQNNGQVVVPVGGIVCAYANSAFTAITQAAVIGEVIQIPASTVYLAEWDTAAGAWVSHNLYIPAGKYVALSGYTATTGSTYGPIFLQRVE